MIKTLLKPLSFLPALMLMYMIYSFSAQPGEVSSALSYKVSYKIVQTADYIFDGGHEEWQLSQWADKINFITRKLAHMTEYFALAVAVSFPLYVYGLHGFLLMLVAGIICVGFSCGDEYHQSFVAGRSPAVKDVCIDSFGVFWGIILVRIIGWTGRKTIFRPRKKKKKAAAYEYEYEQEPAWEEAPAKPKKKLFGRKKKNSREEYYEPQEGHGPQGGYGPGPQQPVYRNPQTRRAPYHYNGPQNQYDPRYAKNPQNGYHPENGDYSPDGNDEPQEGYYDPKNNYEPQNGYYDPENNYQSQNGYDARGDYPPEDSYDNQDNYNPDENYEPQDGYYEPENGYDPQNGYGPEYGYGPEAPVKKKEKRKRLDLRRLCLIHTEKSRLLAAGIFFVTKISQFFWFTFQKRCYNTELNKEIINQIYESD